MKLTKIAIRNFRSYVAHGSDRGLEIGVSNGLNLFVGANNCGKSNLLRAVALSLGDWEGTRFNRAKDCPTQIESKRGAHARFTLTFEINQDVSVEKTLLRYLEEYESAMGPRQTHASNNEVHLCVEYTPNRRVVFLIRGKGNLTGNREQLDKCVKQFRKCLRFVYLKSGEGLGDFMKETLHEILEMVLKEHLSEKFQASENDRQQFIQTLEEGLLHEMGQHLKAELQKVVHEIGLVGIEPKVPLLNEMLSAADIRLGDSAETILLDKGTGIRGVLLVAFLRYLCQHSRRSVVLAIEEPESFLHPEAQLSVRASLEDLAGKEDVTVLVTTHSPLMLSRKPEARISGLIKNSGGETVVDKSIQGDESHAPVVASLYGPSLMPYLLESLQPIESAEKCILFVEGLTDKDYIEHAAKVTENEDLLNGFEIRASRGCIEMVMDALLMTQLTGNSVEILVLFDDDEMGKVAEKIIKRYNFGSREIIHYKDFFNTTKDVPVEAEDMFSQDVLEVFLNQYTEDNVLEEKQRLSKDSFHYGFTRDGKKLFASYVLEAATEEHVEKWIELIRKIRERFHLDDAHTD